MLLRRVLGSFFKGWREIGGLDLWGLDVQIGASPVLFFSSEGT